jgi:hypothetical protein
MSNAIKELQELYLQKQMFLNPDREINSIKMPKFSPIDNVSLSKCVIAYIELNGFVTCRKNIISIHYGLLKREDKNLQFIYNDKAIYININFDGLAHDEYQEQLKKSVTKSGAFYYSVTNFKNFVKWFKLNLIEERGITNE